MKSSSSSSSSSSSTSSNSMSLPFVTGVGENPPIIKLKVKSKGNGDNDASMFVNIHTLQVLNEQHELSYDKLMDLASKYASDSTDGSRLTYVDEEGDVVTILSSEGLAMAMEEPSAGRRYVRMGISVADQQKPVSDGEEKGKKEPAAAFDEPKLCNKALVAATDGMVDDSDDGSEVGMKDSDNTSENGGISQIQEGDLIDWKQCGMDLSYQAPYGCSIECISFSSDGSIMAVGSPNNNSNGTCSGLVRVYERHDGGWAQLGEDIMGSDGYNRCGWSTSLSSNGRVLAVGLPQKDNRRGCVRVYEFVNQQWMQKGNDIVGKADGDWCGRSVSLSSDGTVVAIGSPRNNDNGSSSGHVRVYEYNASGWSQRGSTIGGYRSGDYCGNSVSLSSDGNVLAIGSPWNSDNGPNSGHVRVFKYSTGLWFQKASTIVGKAAGNCGFSVSLSSDGNVLAIGSPDFTGDGNHRTGRARVFEYVSDDGWVQRGDDIMGKYMNSGCGWSVSLSSGGTVVAVGSPQSPLNDKTQCGLVEAFRFASGGWAKIGSDITGKASEDYCGSTVSISSDGKMLAACSPGNESNGHVRVYAL